MDKQANSAILNGSPAGGPLHRRRGMAGGRGRSFSVPGQSHGGFRRPMTVSIETSLAKAMQSIGAGRYQEAEALCRDIVAKQPNNAAALHALGLTHYMVRRYDQAIEHMTKAVQFDGTNAQYYCNLGESLRRAQRPDEAIETFEKALALKPEYLHAHLGMANALRDLGRRPEAMARYRLALALNPRFAEAYNYLGAMFLEQDRKTDAIAVLRKAVAIKPAYMEARLTLAHALDADGQLDEAKQVYEQLIAAQPNNTAAHNNLANLLKSQGRIDEAIAHYERALEINPSNVQAYYNLSRAKTAKSDDKEIARLESMLERPKLTDPERMNVHFALGKIYDDLGRFEAAFGHFEKANDLDSRSAPFDPRAHKALVDRLIVIFTKALFARRQGFGSESALPVFIVGMPRSGTTLIEQVLASHPRVFGAGELDQISHLVNAISAEISGAPPYPESAAELDALTACRLGESYVNYIRRLSGGGFARVTDKMPANFTHLGFIALLLPGARVIHATRDPLDTCLSCYFQHFTAPMPFANKLASLGRYYRGYERLMAHWRQVLPLPMLEVPYEEMVDDHEAMCRKIVEFCGLEWDPVCLQFHKTERTVKTASTWQVRQPLYSTSVARWRHYEAFLAPLKEALGESYPGASGGATAPPPAPGAAGKGKKKKARK